MAHAARHTRDPVPVPHLGPAGAPRFTLTLWTDDPRLAERADAAGVDRIGVDLETLGKAERQSGRGTWISAHRVDDLEPLRAVLGRAALFARVNPVHEGSAAELDAVLGAGVEVVMLPMFASAAEVERFCGLVAGRARVVLLLETLAGLRDLPSVLAVEGVDEVHVGINDMAIEMGMRNRFGVMARHEIDAAAAWARDSGVEFGIAGIGRVGDVSLPIPADLVYAQYARLGACAALLSRSFLGPDPHALDLAEELRRARGRLEYWAGRPRAELEAAREELRRAAAAAGSW